MDVSLTSVNPLLKKAEPAIGALGFMIGVTQADIRIAMNTGANATDSLWTVWDAEKKARFILHNVAGRVGGLSVYSDEFGDGPKNTFKPTGFFNKGLILYIAGAIWKEFKLPYHTTAHKILSPFGLGMSVGGVFDPPVPISQVNALKRSQQGAKNRKTDKIDSSIGQVAPSQRGYWA